MTEPKTHDIYTDGITVWVNGPFTCIGRFGKTGIDIHRDHSNKTEGECLFCTHSPTSKKDWRTFQEKMLEHYGIEVSDKYMPRRFREVVV